VAPSVEVSVVVCVFNEEETISIFLETITPILEKNTESYELLFVNDGSTDRSLEMLISQTRLRDSKVTVVNLSRNFGKDIALSAGLKQAKGKAVIPIDVDLQDPPDLIVEMLKKWRDGADSVIAIRADRSDDSLFKRKSASMFYKLIAKLSTVEIHHNAGDFRLMDRKVVNVVNSMPERSRFMKGIFSYPGFAVETIEFKRQARVAGNTKWNYWRLWNFALDGIFSFSNVPLKIWTYIGMVMAIGSFLYMLAVILKTLVFGVDVPGYASLLSVMLFFNGITMIGIGVLGEYIGRIFDEVKNRPLYVIEGIYGPFLSKKSAIKERIKD
jgi:glycosyltransferase involved in cell wall biosynthesis